MRLHHTLPLFLSIACGSAFDPSKEGATSESDGTGGTEDGFEDGEGSDDDGSGNSEGGDSDDEAGSGSATGGDGSDGSDGSETEPGPDFCVTGPGPDAVETLDDCDYTPLASGDPFSGRIEWAMTHGSVDPTDGTIYPPYTFDDHPTLDSVFQSLVVAQFTDDDSDGAVTGRDTPDIAVLMGDEFASYDSGDDKWSAIRIISGDGTEVHDTLLWDEYGGSEYAPYLFAGLAGGDLNRDGLMELVTIVRVPDDSTTCHVALYEVAANGEVDLVVVSSDTLSCESHAPALADIDGDDQTDILLGSRVYDQDLNLTLAEGSGGQAWFNLGAIGSGSSDRRHYWNSGYHSFAYDMDADGMNMEIVAGSTIYNNDGSIFCTLSGPDVADGYPAVADFDGDGSPEIVVTGNHEVSLYSGTPISRDCDMIATVVNDPYDDRSLPSGITTHPDCDESKAAYGGQPTIADFTGDGTLEIGVAGSCWYSVFDYTASGDLERIAMAQTRDWSSASTGSTVFDFNGDGANEIVFSDEVAVYVWEVDTSPGLQPWERMITRLKDENHRSWTIHEYPVVADVDGDGKAEIVAVNSHLPESPGVPTEHYGIYVIGSGNDEWVSARSSWNQHAYYVTNVDEDGTVGYAPPNYDGHSDEDYNSFRTQAPGTFGTYAASNLYPVASPCQDECGALTIWVQIANESPFIGAREDLPVTLYGVMGDEEVELDGQLMPWRIDPGMLSAPIDFVVDAGVWSLYDALIVRIDEPDSASAWGGANECDEDDNFIPIELSSFCP